MTIKCKVRKKDGSRCTADAQIGKEVCVFHDPEQSAKVRRARRAGGINRTRVAGVLPADTPDSSLKNAFDMSKMIAASINQLRRGQLDPRIANAIGYLASVQLRSFEQGMLEERIAKVESTLGFIAGPQTIHHFEQAAAEGNNAND